MRFRQLGSVSQVAQAFRLHAKRFGERRALLVGLGMLSPASGQSLDAEAQNHQDDAEHEGISAEQPDD